MLFCSRVASALKFQLPLGVSSPMVLAHGVAARLLLNRIGRTTAVLHLIHSPCDGPVEFA